ncbi:peptidoglycan DD-metalloendopeptidase family protein [Luteimonas aquatica]|uniref:peptidoglycan DD-metalloendopeptidase family protein n=1 Tax=Luteimonas aquatica TaxID=450364 RepID=UPI001F5ACE5A|nr:peptidoglycan DD-metalloendopeptidase family protein [Luteimonas aquatica]
MLRRAWVRIAIALLASAVLAACSSSVVRDKRPGRTVSTPKYGATAVVNRGETLYRIATNNGISPLDLATWNNIPPPYTIYPGQRLRLYPGSGRRPVASVPRRATGGTAPSRPPASTAAPTPAPVAAAPVASPFAWRWPTEGQLVGTYIAGNPTRQGVDIAGSAGQPVRAAGDGVVVYSGSGLVGYGELIIIKHNEEWLSAYGHNRARLVNEGQIVKAGQQIAEMGRSGATRDMLHFEIRYNGRPVDPMQYMPRR